MADALTSQPWATKGRVTDGAYANDSVIAA